MYQELVKDRVINTDSSNTISGSDSHDQMQPPLKKGKNSR